MFTQIIRPARIAILARCQTRSLSVSAPRLAGFGQAPKDEKKPATEASNRNATPATGGSQQHEITGDISKAGKNAKGSGSTASGTADPASAQASVYNKTLDGGVSEEMGQGGSDAGQMSSEIHSENDGEKMSSQKTVGQNLRSERGVA